MIRFQQSGFLSNTLWLYADKFGRAFVGFFIATWLARSLGPQQFGELNFAQTIVTSFLPLAYLGMASVVVKLLVQRPELTDEILAASILLRGGAVAVTFPLVLLWAWFLAADAPGVMVLVLVMAFAMLAAMGEGYESELQVRMNNRLLSKIRLFAFGVSTVLKIIFIVLEAPLIWFAVLFSVDALGVTCLLVWHKWQRDGIHFVTWPIQMMKQLAKLAFPVTIVAVVSTFHLKIDVMLLGYMRPEDQVGYYSAAWKMLEALMYIPLMAVSTVAPAISQSHLESKCKFNQTLIQFFGILFWGMLIISGFGAWIGVYVIPLVFGAQYEQTALVFTVLIWLLPLILPSLVTVQWAINQNRLNYLMEVNLVGLFLGVVLGYLLIDEFGLVGAACSAIASYSIAFLIYGLFRPDGREIMRIQWQAFVWPLRWLEQKLAKT